MFGFVNFCFLTKLFKTTATKSEKLPYYFTTVTLQNQQTIRLYKHEQSCGIGFLSSAFDHLLGSAFNSTGDVFFNQLLVPGVERRISKKPGGGFLDGGWRSGVGTELERVASQLDYSLDSIQSQFHSRRQATACNRYKRKSCHPPQQEEQVNSTKNLIPSVWTGCVC